MNSIAVRAAPNLRVEWDESRNGMRLDEVSTTVMVAWWSCPVGHSYRARIQSRLAGTGCGACARNRVLPGFNSFASLHPSESKEWDSARNGPQPIDLASSSTFRAWWVCPIGHHYQRSVRTRSSGSQCPTCRRQLGSGAVKNSRPRSR
ncbi:zinc-ribbon domain-containing protein [Agromyces sp. LHK192]|uniref:zinc-ribbon domain-containing protein n=1 Tax=Agromyces sp. LHK192 TaxID=2498704 RepID=UPI00351308B8